MIKGTEILDYQLDKLAAVRDVGVLLLGDSSLGNAVEARDWERALQRPVLSLALTGDFGYEGSLNMLRRSLRRVRPDLVVLVHTLEMPRRKNRWAGLIYTAERLEDLTDAPPLDIVASLANLDLSGEMLRGWIAGLHANGLALVAADYPAQRARGPDGTGHGGDGRYLAPSALREGAMRTLDRIGALCQSAGVPCLYAHGPYVEPFCSKSEAFVAAANARIAKAGLRVVDGTPLCIPRSEVGDSPEHPAPEWKTAYSDAYQRLVIGAEGGTLGPVAHASR